MTWNKILTYKYDDETTRELHVLNVYSDPDFIGDLLHIAEVGPDIDKILLNGLPTQGFIGPIPHDDNLESLLDVADKYCLTLEEVIHFTSGLPGIMPLPRDKPFDINWEEYNDSDSFSVTFATHIIKKEDFMQIWELIKRKQASKHKGKKPKRKAAENAKLLYAIFKARMKHRKFSNIFKSYESGSLDGYTGSTNQFKTEESLERYYRKYKPTIPPIQE